MLDAAAFTGTLWAAITTAGGPRPAAGTAARHFPAAYGRRWLASLPLPEPGSCGLPVTLLADSDEFGRFASDQDAALASQAQPRTRVYADIGWHHRDAWYALAAGHLTRLAASTLPCACSVFASQAGDESLGLHHDSWYGAVVQVSGAKSWAIGNPPAWQVTTTPGDILLIPKYLHHAVTTPADPGHSVHLAFSLDRDPLPPGADADSLATGHW